MEIIFLLIGITLGSMAGWLAARAALTSKSQQAEALRLAEQERSKALHAQQTEYKKEFDSERPKTSELLQKLATAEANYKNLGRKLEEQKTEVTDMQKKFSADFENLANRILEDKSKKFTDVNKVNLGEMLNPLKEKINAFEKRVEETYDKELRDKISLREEVRKLYDLNHKISEEANNLTRALKGDNKKQGDWGEIILETILERSGLAKDREYRKQTVSTNAEGGIIKPDYLIMLPDNRHIIIDSKVSLVAYDNLVNSDDDDQRADFLKDHLASLKSHVKLLSDKNYYSSLDFNTPDFVLMFVPIESSFSAALQADHELFNYAWERRIIIVSPTTLLATLRTVASIWKMERQSLNALKIAEESGKLYDKFVGFVDDLIKVGKQLDSTKETYTEAMRKLYDGKGNLVSKAEKIKELGAGATKTLDAKLLERATGE
jgi:DNA recombination protein RmuC